MALARVTTWSSGQVLTASALNGEFDNLITNALSSPVSEIQFNNDAAVATATGRLRRNAAMLTWHDGTNALPLNPQQGANIASAATLPIGTDGDYFHVTGSTGPITALSTRSAGVQVTLTFDSTPTITHNATSLALIGAVNRVCVAKDTMVLRSEGSGNWREISRNASTSTNVIPSNVVQAVKTDTTSTTSTSYADIAGMTVTITPTAATSRVLVFSQICGNNGSDDGAVQLVRGATPLNIGDTASSRTRATVGNWGENFTGLGNAFQTVPIMYVDSPATTSATIYKLQWIVRSGTNYLNRGSGDGDFAGMPRGASSIIVMEIGA